MSPGKFILGDRQLRRRVRDYTEHRNSGAAGPSTGQDLPGLRGRSRPGRRHLPGMRRHRQTALASMPALRRHSLRLHQRTRRGRRHALHSRLRLRVGCQRSRLGNPAPAVAGDAERCPLSAGHDRSVRVQRSRSGPRRPRRCGCRQSRPMRARGAAPARPASLREPRSGAARQAPSWRMGAIATHAASHCPRKAGLWSGSARTGSGKLGLLSKRAHRYRDSPAPASRRPDEGLSQSRAVVDSAAHLARGTVNRMWLLNLDFRSDADVVLDCEGKLRAGRGSVLGAGVGPPLD